MNVNNPLLKIITTSMVVLLVACSESNNDEEKIGATINTSNNSVIKAEETSGEEGTEIDLSDPELIARGKKMYVLCQACHAIEANAGMKIGPTLHDIFNRKAASVESFAYSESLKSMAIVWDEQALDKLITNPAKMIPGTKMSFMGIKDEKTRKAIIAYVSTL